ncbi:4Fe-4S binding protein [Enterovibrio norvegicus]|uniref:4Fe-4S binding protein n=1 Tax=Enterovibrio norvegicus TaxID=188144 RepID=UPI0013D01ED4|nr:4Fe-4S binding protein [Enterovibrio norvegicus]
MSDRDERYYTAQLNMQTCSRRGLFRGLWSGVSKPVKTQAGLAAKRTAPRPPTAVDENLLDRLCDGCGKCADACPQRIISMLEGKPALTLDGGACTECAECQRACPTLALANSSPDTLPSTGAVATLSGMCIRQMSAPCQSCSEACPHQAIDTVNRSIAIDTEKCSGCAQCRVACPAHAIQMVMR